MSCVNTTSLVYVLLSIVTIITLAYVGLQPQRVRQQRENLKFKERKIKQHIKGNYPRLEQEYHDFVAKGYPNTRQADIRLYGTPDYFIGLVGGTEIEKMFLSGSLAYPEVSLTDARYIVFATVPSAIVVAAQVLFPAC